MADNITENQRYTRGKNPNSLKNLKPFVKGTSGHPGRTPKDYSLTSLLKEQIDTIPLGEKNGRTWRQLLVLAWLTGAMKQPVLMKEILDRLEGKVTQPIAGENGEPIKYEITVKDGESQKLTEQLFKGGSVVSNISLS